MTGLRRKGVSNTQIGPYLRGAFVEPTWVSAIVEDEGLDLDFCKKTSFSNCVKVFHLFVRCPLVVSIC